MLEYNAEIDKQGKNGWTALMYAVASGQLKIACKLLEDGADLYIKNNDAKNSFDLILFFWDSAKSDYKERCKEEFEEAMLAVIKNKKK